MRIWLHLFFVLMIVQCSNGNIDRLAPKYYPPNVGDSLFYVGTTEYHEYDLFSLDTIYPDTIFIYRMYKDSITFVIKSNDFLHDRREKLLQVVLKERDSLSKRMDHFIEMRLNGELSKEVFAEKQKPMEERLRQLNDQLPEIQAEIDFFKIQHRTSDVVLNNGKNLYEEWPKMELEDKRAIVETITEKITIGKEDINIKLRHLPSINPSHTADPTQSNNQNNGNKQKTTNFTPIQNPGKRQSNHSVLLWLMTVSLRRACIIIT